MKVDMIRRESLIIELMTERSRLPLKFEIVEVKTGKRI